MLRMVVMVSQMAYGQSSLIIDSQRLTSFFGCDGMKGKSLLVVWCVRESSYFCRCKSVRNMNKKTILLSCLVALAFAGCSSDAEEDEAYQYTTDELCRIHELQEEYGVDFDFPTTADAPLPDVDDVEALCRMLSKMRSASRHAEVRGDTATFTTRSRVVRKSGNRVESYSGSHTGSGTLGVEGKQSEVFEYTITWSNVNATDKIDATGEILSWPYLNNWTFTEPKFSFSFHASSMLEYTITFTAYHMDSHFPYKASLTNTINLKAGI